MATVFIDTRPIKVVSVHLIGGRFDDIQAIQSDDYIAEKITQIKAVVAMDPDIICGDFNTKFRTPMIETATDLYFDSIVDKMTGVSQSMRAIYKSRWDKWIYMDTIHKYLKSAGYKSVYHSDAGTLHTQIQNTSSFGGIVDMIYYKSNKLQLDVSSVDIVGYNSVMKEHETLNTYDPVLSDHYPVKATFSVI
jgi:endonuclease/exonuclease/phosphatase family metal-dependent hydrolase